VSCPMQKRRPAKATLRNSAENDLSGTDSGTGRVLQGHPPPAIGGQHYEGAGALQQRYGHRPHHWARLGMA
jgi:hypothetical protein